MNDLAKAPCIKYARLRHVIRSLFFFQIRLSAAILVAALAMTVSCQKEKPVIKIGFAGGLTGRYSDLGTAGRNGVILAVEEINKAGGINGRPLELLIKDDRQDPARALEVDSELIKEGVAAIIGHMTSAMSTAVMPLINEKKTLLLSPTTSTGELTGKDDWFMRVVGTSIETPRRLADYAFGRAGTDRIAVIYDLENRAYCESYAEAFNSRFKELGGLLSSVVTYSKGDDASFEMLAMRLVSSGCSGVLVIASAIDAAMICQQIRKIEKSLPFFSSGWAMTDEFIQNGGRAVEGVVIAEFFITGSESEEYVAFKESFKNRFGAEPSFPAGYGYEAAMVLFSALSKEHDPLKLKQTIVAIKRFKGLQGDFEIDSFGDAVRKLSVTKVSDGQFRTLE